MGLLTVNVMPGPLIESLKKALDVKEDNEESREVTRVGRIVREHREELTEEMDEGGCCDATMAAEAIRERGRRYK